MKYNICSILLISALIFSGCGTSNRFASSFGKRKYNKGYYWNIPLSAVAVNSVADHNAGRHEYMQKKATTILPAEVSKDERVMNKQMREEMATVVSKSMHKQSGGVSLQSQVLPIVNIVTSDGRHVSDGKASGSKKGLSVISFVLFILSLVCIASASAIAVTVYASASLIELAVTFLFAGLLLDLLAFIFGCIAIARNDRYRGLAWFVVIFNILFFLFFAWALLTGEIFF